ncbi:hypothetical protein B0T18DRAFT_312366, partial [Schizothecium vesticola]
KKTYSTRDSLVVSDLTTSLAISGLSMGEWTGSRVFPCALILGVKYTEFGSPAGKWDASNVRKAGHPRTQDGIL